MDTSAIFCNTLHCEVKALPAIGTVSDLFAVERLSRGQSWTGGQLAGCRSMTDALLDLVKHHETRALFQLLLFSISRLWDGL